MNEVINLNTLSRYLLNGTYAKPKSHHFLNNHFYDEIESISISKDKTQDIDNILEILRSSVKNLLLKNKKISLLITSGFDSYLIYLLLKEQNSILNYGNEIDFITGRFQEPYDEYLELQKKRPKIVLSQECQPIDDVNEALRLLYMAVNFADQPVNGLVAAAVLKAYLLAFKNNSTVVLGTGETIFFTSTYDFVDRVINSDTRSYAADKTIQTESSYLTTRGLDFAKKSMEDYKNLDYKIFEHSNKLEKFIHDQQFLIDAPRVDYETYSYSRALGLKTYTPLRDPRLLEAFLNLPPEKQHDGRPKTVIRELIKFLENGLMPEYYDGLKMTSPQREYFRYEGKDGGFGSLMNYFIENSLLASLGLVEVNKVVSEYDKYKDDFDTVYHTEEFKRFSSYSLWKFFICEFWLYQKKGYSIEDFLKINNS